MMTAVNNLPQFTKDMKMSQEKEILDMTLKKLIKSILEYSAWIQSKPYYF